MRFRVVLLLSALLLACSWLPAQSGTEPLFVTVADIRDAREAARLLTALAQAGFHGLPVPDPSGDGLTHVRVGPFNSQAEASGSYKGVTAPDAGRCKRQFRHEHGWIGGSLWTNRNGYDRDLNPCITISHRLDPITGDYKTLRNSCNEDTHVYFFVTSAVKGGLVLGAGLTEEVYPWPEVQAAGGHVSIYACPVLDSPSTATGASRQRPETCASAAPGRKK